MPNISVDGFDYEVTEGENLLHACLSHGLDLPYFCWHPAMGSVGACRQCAVLAYKDENDNHGRLTMACMTPVADGARISITARHAQEFRAAVIEWLMENHPHDCPVCEEGGECHLQDMTVMTGHTSRRYRGSKRTWENQYLGPFVNHEMNRCITCYRCVRFYRDYAGGTDLQAFGSRGRMYFGRVADGVLESEFAGNLVEVCPTGVFTDKPFSATYTRKWDLQSAPSVCTGCAIGCNTFASERYGELKRIHNRYHAAINRYFLCDRGRFGMSYVNSEDRIRQVGERVEAGVFQPITASSAVARVVQMLSAGRTVGVGSPRASVEDNHALRALVGEENFCAGLSSREASLVALACQLRGEGIPTLHDVEQADAVLVLGEDLLNTAPRLALAIRQAGRNETFAMAGNVGVPQWQDAGVRGHAQHASNPLLIASLLPTGLDDSADQTLNAPPEVIARCGYQIAHRLSADYVAVDGLSASAAEFVDAAVSALADAQHPLIVTGVSTGERGMLQAASNIVGALRSRNRESRLLICGAEANSFGVSLFGSGLAMDAMLRSVADGSADTLIVMQNDLFRRADSELVTEALSKVANVIVFDSLANSTAEASHLLFPAATVAEATGTLVNYEYRAQRFYQVFVPNGDIQSGWRWVADIASALGRDDINWQHTDDVLRDCERLPEWSGITDVAPSADYRSVAGQKVPRESHRYSGRTAMYADVTMHEPKTQVDEETPFSYSMEGLNANQPGALVPYVWSPGWNSNQSLFKFQQEVGGSLTGGDPGVHLAADVNADVESVADTSAEGYSHPPLERPRSGAGFKLFALPTLFGSEELSAYAVAIKERMPFPFLVMNPDDAASLGVTAGAGVRCEECSLEVRIDEAIAPGTAAVPVGMPHAPLWLPDGPVALARDAGFAQRPIIIARG
ncbi:MAG: NADH-quinone oxidoreductase subunit NuoG [Pseudomonadales bacterium]